MRWSYKIRVGIVVVRRSYMYKWVQDVQAVVEGHLQPQGQQNDGHQHLHA